MTVVAANQVAHQRVFLVDSRGHLVSPAARQAEPTAVAARTFREQDRAETEPSAPTMACQR